MTLDNCKKLLEHYEKIVDGRTVAPASQTHINWNDVISNAKVRAKEMEKRIEHKLTLPQYGGEAKEEEKVKPIPDKEEEGFLNKIKGVVRGKKPKR